MDLDFLFLKNNNKLVKFRKGLLLLSYLNCNKSRIVDFCLIYVLKTRGIITYFQAKVVR